MAGVLICHSWGGGERFSVVFVSSQMPTSIMCPQQKIQKEEMISKFLFLAVSLLIVLSYRAIVSFCTNWVNFLK